MLSDDLNIYLIQTDIEEQTEDFFQLLDLYDNNHSNLMCIPFEKFQDTIKMIDLSGNEDGFDTVTKKDLA